MKKISFVLVMLLLLTIFSTSCGKSQDTQVKSETQVTQEVTSTLDITDETTTEVPRNIEYVEQLEGVFTFTVNGKNFEFGKTIGELMEGFGAQSFYGYQEYSVAPDSSGIIFFDIYHNYRDLVYVVGYNETDSLVKNVMDLKTFRLEVDILNADTDFFTLKDGIKFGSTYEEIISAFGEPSYTETVTNEDINCNIGGEEIEIYCIGDGIPIRNGDEGTLLNYSYSENSYIEFILFESTGLMQVEMNYDIGQ